MTSNIQRRCTLDLAGSSWAEVLTRPLPKSTVFRSVEPPPAALPKAPIERASPRSRRSQEEAARWLESLK